MNSKNPKMDQQIELAIIAAIKAGKKILEIYQLPEIDFESKADNSPITIADKEANSIITEILSGSFPVLSEEGKSIPWNERKKWHKFWLVDPLDGTKEFISKNGEFTVNIALIENGSPVAGVIFVPVSSELYYASIEGSFKTSVNPDEPLNIPLLKKRSVKLPHIVNNKDYVVVGSRSHLNQETSEFIEKIDTGGKKLQLVTKGSSLKLCLVATGEADIYPRLGPTMEWDIAAGHAIALFVGKEIKQYPSGQPIFYNKENLLNPFFVVK